MSVNIFVINSNENSRNADMNICLMIRDVKVYGCECVSDAVILAETVSADVIFVRLFANDIDPINDLKQIIDNHKNSIVVVSLNNIKDSHIYQDIFLKSGITSVFVDDIHKDKFLYVIKNYIDIVRRKRVKIQQDRLLLSLNSNSHSFIYEVNGYNDILSMNKLIGNLNLNSKFQKNLVFIRVFSFLYDFLIKCFLSEIKIHIGFIIDTYRVIVVFQNDANIRQILETAVFYSISKDYITSDENFNKLYIDIYNTQSLTNFSIIEDLIPLYKNISSLNIEDLAKFEDTISNIPIGMTDLTPIINISKYLENHFDIFSYLSEYLSRYNPSIEVEFVRDLLIELCRDIDNSVYSLRNEIKAHSENIFKCENILYEAIIKFQVMLNICQKSSI